MTSGRQARREDRNGVGFRRCASTQVAALAMLMALGAASTPNMARASAAATSDTTASAPAHSAYAARRDQLRARITELGRAGPRSAQLAAMQALQSLAEANGDPDLAQLMQAERIFAVHDDASIDASIAEVNAVRSQVRPGASAELREALERIYGNLYFDAGNFSLALDHQLKALALTEHLPQDRAQARLYRLATISELYNAMELPERALQYADDGLQLASTAVAFDGSRISLLGARALALMQLGRHDDAARALDQAEAIDAGPRPWFNALRLPHTAPRCRSQPASPRRHWPPSTASRRSPRSRTTAITRCARGCCVARHGWRRVRSKPALRKCAARSTTSNAADR
jgi:tetratricopeptide (TPR) repeat protein